MAWNVVIAGGGFGGFYAARTLEKILPPQAARITLVNDVNFMLYAPLLPGAAGGTLEPRHVTVPLREALGHTDLRLGQVVGANPDERCLKVKTLEGHEERLQYDHLIVALGSVSRTLPIPGLAEHAIGFKSLSEAIELRNSLIRTLEMAETIEDPKIREQYLTYVFVGGGYAGVEGLAELQDFAADAIEQYPRCRNVGLRFVLVEAAERIMRETAPDLAEYCMRELRGRGIEIRTRTQVKEVTDTDVLISTGERIPTRTVVWTAGVKPHPVVERLGLPLEKGRIKTDRYLQVEGFGNVWALGDAAAVPDPAKDYKEPCPPTAQHSIREGRLVARNVAAAMGSGGKKKPFTYKTKGAFVDLGRRQAVASTMGIKWRGTPAWLLARTYHLAMMPGAGRRARLLVDWNIGLLFGRDLAELGQLGHAPALPSVGGQTQGHLEGQSQGGTGAQPDGTPATVPTPSASASDA